MPFEGAALIGCGVTTGVGAVLNTARIEAGSTVAVFGAGGVGLSAIQGARIGGARMIIAVDVFENKLATAKELGGDIKIVEYTHFVKGEGLEKRTEDFAAEVAAAIKG